MAAAASLSGSILGYSIALASAIANSVNLQDMLIWGCIALLVQLFAYFAARVMLPGLVLDIPENKVASGIFLGAISLSMGLLNAASLIINELNRSLKLCHVFLPCSAYRWCCYRFAGNGSTSCFCFTSANRRHHTTV
jgi:hypothetical protein